MKVEPLNQARPIRHAPKKKEGLYRKRKPRVTSQSNAEGANNENTSWTGGPLAGEQTSKSHRSLAPQARRSEQIRSGTQQGQGEAPVALAGHSPENRWVWQAWPCKMNRSGALKCVNETPVALAVYSSENESASHVARRHR